MSDRVIGVIPARLNSQRLRTKLLADLAGKSLLQRTFENARQVSALDDLIILADDEQIISHAASFGAKALLTPVDCANGTSRISWALANYPELSDSSVIVNIQGDEPFLQHETVAQVIASLHSHPDCAVATAATPFQSVESFLSPSCVKCVCSCSGKALYFSRSPIPYEADLQRVPPEALHHLGLYAYRKTFLNTFLSLPTTPLQQRENLEQLTILETGFGLSVAVVKEAPGGIDTPEDLQQARKKLCTPDSSLSLAESSPH